MTCLLFNLQTVNDRGKFTENLVGLLVELNLSSKELGQVAQGFGGIDNLFVG